LHIGILTGGGDVPGLNPCIRAVTLAAADRGWRVTGIRRGWAGLLAPSAELTTLDRETVRGIDRYGGTILHTSRVDPRKVDGEDRTGDVLDALRSQGIDALVTLGGDGTLRFSAHLSSLGVPVISVPKTMDNDVFGTDYCLGFSTAVSRSVEAITRLRTTTASHERIAVIELFGRRSGETALLAGFLAQVDRTVISEVPVELDRLLPLLEEDKKTNPANYAVLVVSEGARLGDGVLDPDIGKSATARSEKRIGTAIARAIEARTGNGTVVQELAYLMRSGEPDALDRMAGFAFGALAVQLIETGQTGRMVAVRTGAYDHVPIDTLLTGSKGVDVEALYDPSAYRAKLARIEGMPLFLY
jgi:ATP-dependent phosphofructokinase / diphosphate-dependent phosphofructokinase